MTDECTAGYRAIDLSKQTHKWHRLPSVVSTRLNESSEIIRKHCFLSREVTFEGLAGEKGVQSFAIIDMSLSVKEYPTIGTDNIFCNWNKAWLYKSRRVEDFVREIAVGGEDDESANDRLVDDTVFNCGDVYLWKTDIQLSLPLAHCFLYSSKSGYSA